MLTNWYFRDGRFYADVKNKRGFYEFHSFAFFRVNPTNIMIQLNGEQTKLNLQNFKADNYFFPRTKFGN